MPLREFTDPEWAPLLEKDRAVAVACDSLA